MSPSPIQDPTLLARLILYIVNQLNAMGRRPSTIQIVKILYLIDLEHYRSMKKCLTGLRWRHHFFGPYAFELPEIMSQIGYRIAEERFEAGGFEGSTYSVDEEAPFPDELPFYVQGVVDRVLKKWGLADTREILDYVYFETEPMRGTNEGDELDFHSVLPNRGSYEISIAHPPEHLARSRRERLSKHKAPYGRIKKRVAEPPPRELLDALDELDKGD